MDTAMNTDRELWRELTKRDSDGGNNSGMEPYVFVTKQGSIGFNHYGSCVVKTIERWVKDSWNVKDVTSVEVDGRWITAKEEPYQLFGINKLLCNLGFHEWIQSKKYAHTKICFRCGRRNQNMKFDY